MRPLDGIGNKLEKNDLVMLSDDKGNVMLCLVFDIIEPSVIAPLTKTPMETVGSVILQPMPITCTFTNNQPRITTLVKAVKPTEMTKPQA